MNKISEYYKLAELYLNKRKLPHGKREAGVREGITAINIGMEYNVSKDTIFRAVKLKETLDRLRGQIDEAIYNKILEGKIRIPLKLLYKTEVDEIKERLSLT